MKNNVISSYKKQGVEQKSEYSTLHQFSNTWLLKICMIHVLFEIYNFFFVILPAEGKMLVLLYW